MIGHWFSRYLTSQDILIKVLLDIFSFRHFSEINKFLLCTLVRFITDKEQETNFEQTLITKTSLTRDTVMNYVGKIKPKYLCQLSWWKYDDIILSISFCLINCPFCPFLVRTILMGFTGRGRGRKHYIYTTKYLNHFHLTMLYARAFISLHSSGLYNVQRDGGEVSLGSGKAWWTMMSHYKGIISFKEPQRPHKSPNALRWASVSLCKFD